MIYIPHFNKAIRTQKKITLTQKGKPAIELDKCAVHKNFLTALGKKQIIAYAG